MQKLFVECVPEVGMAGAQERVQLKRVPQVMALQRETLIDLAQEQTPRAKGSVSRHRLYDFFMQAPTMIAVTCGPNHVFEFANATYLQIAGRREQDVLCKSVREVYPEISGQGYYERFDQVYNTGTPSVGNKVPARYNRYDEETPYEAFFNFILQPLRNDEGEVEGVLIQAVEVTDLVRASLRVEELEPIDEQLQIANEQLQTLNAELHSSNKELQTLNAELHSSNKELQTLTALLGKCSGELNQVQAFLESILNSLPSGVVVLDRDLRVQVWNLKAKDLWDLWAGEVQGSHFLNLDINLPVEQLIQPIRVCLAGECESYKVTLDARSRRGKALQCQVTCTPLVGMGADIRGVILLMSELKGG